MAVGNLFGSGGESNSLYGTSLSNGGAIPAASSFIYFEWFIFKVSASQPATPTGGTWDFLTNTGTPPTGWASTEAGIPLDNLWFSIAFVDSRNPTNLIWSEPGLISATTSVYATAYADTFTGTGSTTVWTLTADPVVVANLDVSINGVTQTPTVDYTISGTTFTTTTAAPLGSVLLVKYRQALPNSYFGSASNVGYTPAGTGAVITNVQAKLRQTVSVMDFGAVGDGVADDTAAINAANTYCFTNNATLDFPAPASFYKITSNVTITCDMTAGWYQIFDSASAYTVAGLREYRFEWWGAKGNAVSPATPVLGVNLSSFDPVTQLPTGTNDSAAIRATMLNAYSSEMMSNYLDPTVYPAIPGPNIGPGSQPYWPSKQMTGYRSVVKGRPGAGYLCSGTNILGPQNIANNKIFFDGQGCSFEWIPANVYDYFIDALDLISEPVYQHFEVRNWGHLGYKGVFCHAGLLSGNRKAYGNFLKGPLFHNVRLDAGGNYWYYASNPAGTLHYPDVNAWKTCFFIEGTNLNATWEISHGQMYAFEKFWHCTNPEAVACNIHDTEIGSFTPSAKFFDFSGSFSGGFWVNNCEIGLVGATQTLLTTSTTSTTQVSSLPFAFRDCRVETRADDFILFDLEFGDLYVDNMFPDAGNGTSRANAIAVRALKYTKKVTIVNSWMPQKIIIGAYTSTEWSNLGGAAFAILLDGCTTPSGVPVVSLQKTDGSAISLPDVYRQFLRFRTVKYVNPNNGLPWTISMGANNDQAYHTSTLGTYNQTDGNMYVNTNGAFPIGVLITSIVVTALASNLAVTDRIVIQWPVSGPSFTAMLSATDTIKTELIPSNKQGVCVLSTTSGYNNYLINYYLGGASSSTKVNANVKITYRPIYSLAEIGGTDVTALV